MVCLLSIALAICVMASGVLAPIRFFANAGLLSASIQAVRVLASAIWITFVKKA